VIVTHDQALSLACERVITIEDGVILSDETRTPGGPMLDFNDADDEAPTSAKDE